MGDGKNPFEEEHNIGDFHTFDSRMTYKCSYCGKSHYYNSAIGKAHLGKHRKSKSEGNKEPKHEKTEGEGSKDMKIVAAIQKKYPSVPRGRINSWLKEVKGDIGNDLYDMPMSDILDDFEEYGKKWSKKSMEKRQERIQR